MRGKPSRGEILFLVVVIQKDVRIRYFPTSFTVSAIKKPSFAWIKVHVQSSKFIDRGLFV